MSNSRKIFLSILFIGLLWPQSARAQFQGSVALATVNATVANGVTCTGSAQNFITGTVQGFDNLGQTSHLATATSGASAFQMEIDGIDKLNNVFRLSDLQLGVPTSAKGGLVVTASGYMPRIQISVTCTTGATFSVSYSGSFSPQPPNIGGALLSAVEKLPFQTSAANTTNSVTFQTPNGNSAGTIVFQYSATGPAGSSVTAQCVTNTSTNLQSFVFNLLTGSTVQFFTITPSSCPFVTLTYTSGGASAVTYNLEYVFNAAGTQATLNTPNLGPASTSSLAVVSDALAQAFTSSGGQTNPGVTANLISVFVNNVSKAIYFDTAVVTCTAACVVNVFQITSTGTGCSVPTPGNMRLGSTNTSIATMVGSGCAVQPTFGIAGYASINVGPNAPVVLDLRGFIIPSGTANNGFGVTVAAFTGTANANLRWYEK